jgi:AhpD family alkylhydroperoxidase
MSTTFDRRIYTLAAFRIAVKDVFGRMEELRRAARSGRVSRAFAEKIMLAVTRVNGCRYCAYGHTHAALAMGVKETEIQQIISGELGSFPEQEAVALAFAQHSAECASKPDLVAEQRLVAYYGPETSGDIQAYLRIITFGNLYGNTFDAFLSRLSGAPAAGSSLWSELGVLLGAFVLVPLELLKRTIQPRSNHSMKAGSNFTISKEKNI